MKRYIMPVIAGVVCLGGGFYGGVTYQKSKLPAFPGRGSLANGGLTRQLTRPAGMSGGISGVVESKDDKSITIKTDNGSTETVYYSSSTAITKDADASMDGVTVGVKLVVTGEPNSDNSVTAKTIRLTD